MTLWGKEALALVQWLVRVVCISRAHLECSVDMARCSVVALFFVQLSDVPVDYANNVYQTHV